MRAKVKDSDIASLIVAGKNNSEIARALHVDRKRVAKVRSLANLPSESLKQPVPIDTVRAVVRLEMSQEETLNEFSDQLAEYTTNYRNAMDRDDEVMAGKWADAASWAIFGIKVVMMVMANNPCGKTKNAKAV